jgi:hypothetical protein
MLQLQGSGRHLEVVAAATDMIPQLLLLGNSRASAGVSAADVTVASQQRLCD